MIFRALFFFAGTAVKTVIAFPLSCPYTIIKPQKRRIRLLPGRSVSNYMAKIAVILPQWDMLELVRPLIQSLHMDHSVVMLCDGSSLETDTLVKQARDLGADIILTRGLIAAKIRQCCDIPVVEMRVTAQELGLLVLKAKELSRRRPPTIGLVGTRNMFCDFSRFNELFDVILSPYLFPQNAPDPTAQLAEQSARAVADHMDVIIGGATACAVAEGNHVPCVFLASTPDSIRDGLRATRQVAYAIDLQKNNAAEIRVMLDNSFSISVKLDRSGCISDINRAAVSRLDWQPQKVKNQPLTSLIPEISQHQLNQVLLSGKELFSIFVTINGEQLVANLAPIHAANGEITGGILSCDEVRRIESISADVRREQQRRRFSAQHQFSDFAPRAPVLQTLFDTAGCFAKSDAPVFLWGEPGCKPFILAECIHNASARREMPFIAVDCGELSPDEQLHALFGVSFEHPNAPHSFCSLAHTGTLYLRHVENLCLSAQRRFYRLLTQKLLSDPSWSTPLPLDVRVIASSLFSMSELYSDRRMDPEFLLALNCLTLRLPPLRDFAEEIFPLADTYIQTYLKKYKRYISVTAGGKAWFSQQEWPGNLLQLEHFCERLVLLSPRRSVDEVQLSSLYQTMAPHFHHEEPAKPEQVYVDAEAGRILAALSLYQGNRTATAKALGISTSTLWRKIKKYRIKI